MLHSLIYFIIALAILIAFHEFGHFWAARKTGVKVLRFSIGFGKILWRYQKSPDSTEFAVAAIPLGGYVKMVDEREGAVAARDLPYAFNRQRLPVRTAIVLAGPLFNLFLAVLLYWIVLIVGETGLRPVIGPVESGTFAEQAGFEQGDEIVSVAGNETPTWTLALSTLFTKLMDGDRVVIEVKSIDGVKRTRVLDIPAEVSAKPDLLHERLGLAFWEPEVPPRLDKIQAGSAAERAGLKPGDLVISSDGEPVSSWLQWVKIIRERPDVEIKVVVERDGVRIPLAIRPDRVASPTGEIGRIGATVVVPEETYASMRVEYRLGIFSALVAATKQTAEYSALTVKLIGRMITGKASVQNLSGPISIAQFAGQSASLGFVPFLKFLAIVSISLGVLNLLPIPVLDGGHLLFYLIEAIKGSPLSDTAQYVFQQIGIFILISLMGLAFFVDIERLFS
ncbi:MAG: RIP metalloprotease RseP [Pseudomonadota bacterium]